MEPKGASYNVSLIPRSPSPFHLHGQSLKGEGEPGTGNEASRSILSCFSFVMVKSIHKCILIGSGGM